jgi:alpha-L-arabinofuranosidase
MGALRAKAGHPAPFNLKYMEIGNENGGKAYYERWPLFVNAIKARYPEMKLIANVWNGVPNNIPPEILDEHYYSDPEFFIRNATKYDKYDRNGPKIYVGEYAVTKNAGLGNLRGAVGEAAFMTGMERNSDVVIMASYAPLFCNANHKRWPVNLINYDSRRVFGIPSYYVQQMFAQNRGDVVLPTAVETSLTEGGIHGAAGVGTWNTQAEFKDIRVTRDGETLAAPDLKDAKGLRLLGKGEWKAAEGVLTQNGSAENVLAVIGDSSWSNYTISFKARKLGGSEGFLVAFGMPNDKAKSWWNIGGWGNTHYGLEVDGLDAMVAPGWPAMAPKVPGKIETGRWYDIRVEIQGRHVRCYLDGKLIHDALIAPLKTLHASASLDEKTGETILKVVNADTNAREAEINLTGAPKIAAAAKAIVLTSGNATDENTLEEPNKVAPKEITIRNAASQFRHSFPANSVTVMRLKNQ